MPRLLPIALLALSLPACAPAPEDPDGDPTPAWSPDYPRDGELRLTAIQALGTHNSYHLPPSEAPPPVWDYGHAPLDVQLGELGVRQFELDVHRDPDTGDFAVYHVGLLDGRSTCAWLDECLGILRSWSDAHPGHHALVLLIEPKDETPAWEAADFLDALDEALLAAWPQERLIVPERVRGGAPTIREGALAGGWPTLGEGRGRLIVQLHDEGALGEAYTEGWTRTDRPMFAHVGPEHDFAGLVALNDPVGDFDRIQAAVAEGLLVRTRADASPEDFAGGDTAHLEAALASGAQLISTDHPSPEETTGYVAAIPGGTPSRCNPRAAPADCRPEDVEDPAQLGPP